MNIPQEVMPYYLAALQELLNPDIDFTRSLLIETGLEQVDGEYVCDRFSEQEYSVRFYFRVKGSHYYYRVLVVKDDIFAYSSKIVSGNYGKLRIKNESNFRTHSDWIACFKDPSRLEVVGDAVYFSINENGAYDLDEIIDLFVESIHEKKRQLLRITHWRTSAFW